MRPLRRDLKQFASAAPYLIGYRLRVRRRLRPAAHRYKEDMGLDRANAIAAAGER